MKILIQKYAVAAYFALTFAVSWGGILLVVGGPSGFTGGAAQEDPRFPLVYLAMLAGPATAGILMTVFAGRSGRRDFLWRLQQWRVGIRWYATALLIAPVVVTTVLLLLSIYSTEFLPGIFARGQNARAVLFGLAVGIGAGIFEEIGWTGFVIPRLLRQHGIIRTGVWVGLIWAVWHVLAVVWGIGSIAGAIPLALFVPLDLLAFLPVYRVLMVWVYHRTGSLPVSILMHASLTATLLILGPVGLTGARFLAFDLAGAAALWGIVALVIARPRTAHRAAPARAIA